MVRSTSSLTITVVVLGVGCGGSVPDQAAVMFRGDAARSGVFPAPAAAASALVEWTLSTGGPVRASPVLAGSIVIVGSTDGSVYAVDRTTGALQWRTDIGSPVTASAAAAGDRVFVGDRANRFFGLDLESGRIVWQVDTGPDIPWPWGHEGWDYFTSSPAVVDDLVVAGSGDGNIYAFDAGSGAERWRFPTAGRVRASPAVVDSTVLVGSADGRFYALDLGSGALRWSFDTEGANLRAADFGFDRTTIQSSAAVASGVAYFGSRDGSAYALDVATGSLRWQWRFEQPTSWIVASPAVASGRVCLAGSDGLYVACLDAGTGEQRWAYRTDHRVFSSPAIAGSSLYVGSHAGRLLALDVDSGELQWRLALDDAVMSSPAVTETHIYVGADDGSLHAIRLSRQPPPLRAVYWDSTRLGWNLFPTHEEVRDEFARHDYAVLGRSALGEFLRSRVDDRRPSVVVFAMDDLPPEADGDDPDDHLLLRYLRQGGKVVWLGIPPGFVTRDSTGIITGTSYADPGSLLGVDFEAFNTDRYGAFPAPGGRVWGLAESWVASGGITPGGVTEVLAHDELGGAAAWVQSYGGPRGAGFVYLGFGVLPAYASHLAQIRAVAEHGIGTVAEEY